MIICIGAFDGYHRGHLSLFAKAREMAARDAEGWRLLTFVPHPRYFFGSLSEKLFLEGDKTFLRRNLDIPEPIEIPFTKRFAETAPGDFLNELRSKFNVRGIVVGELFRFGRNRSGTGRFLRQYCAANGLELALMPQYVTGDGVSISSTRIRGLVQQGLLDSAAELLGYPYFLFSRVLPGEQRGRKLGYPTANMLPDEDKLIPAEGVYAGALRHGDRWYPAAISIGRNPTFLEQGILRIETHVIGFSGNLYGKRPLVVFFRRLRAMSRFENAESLILQLQEDCRESLQVFSNSTGLLEIFRFFPFEE